MKKKKDIFIHELLITVLEGSNCADLWFCYLKYLDQWNKYLLMDQSIKTMLEVDLPPFIEEVTEMQRGQVI